MSSEKRNELIEKLRKPKQLFKVALVDDFGEEIATQIEDDIDCYARTLPIDSLSRIIDNKAFESLLKYDAIFFDATYEKDGIEAVGLLENLIKIRPEFKENCKVFIGTDIREHGRFGNNDKVKLLIARVKQLPNVIYGGKKTKIESMIRCITQQGLKKGIQVPKKQSKGICRPELLELIKPHLNSINKNLKEQGALSINLENAIQGFEPSNEDERKIIEYVRETAELFRTNKHTISQVSVALNMACSTAEIQNNKKSEGR